MSRPDVDAMAAEVVSIVKSAVDPLNARIAVLESREIPAPVVLPPIVPPEDVAALRDRVETLEGKSADVVQQNALAPIQQRLTVLEQKTESPEIAPDDIAASVAGVLRKELADLEPTPARTKTVLDGQGEVKYRIEETT